MHTPEVEHSSNRVLAALPREIFRLLERDLKLVSLERGVICHSPGDPINQIYFPASGMISLVVATSHGDTIETSMIGREGALGLQSALGKRQSFVRAVVQIRGEFSIIPSLQFEQVVNGSPTVRDLVVGYIETSWAESQQLAACNAIHNGFSRLCRWLLQTADRTGSDHLPLTQQLLAEMLGVRRTTVTLLAQELQQRGVINYGRGKIAVLDRRALEADACECYEAMKHENLSTKIGLRF